jgi:hypothetical protein
MVFRFWLPLMTVLCMIALSFLIYVQLYRRTHFSFIIQDKVAGIGVFLVGAIPLVTILGFIILLVKTNNDNFKNTVFSFFSIFTFTMAYFSIWSYVSAPRPKPDDQNSSLIVFFRFQAVVAFIIEAITVFLFLIH